MDRSIYKIKLRFTIAIGFLCITIISGSLVIHNTKFFTPENIVRNISFFKYKIAFAENGKAFGLHSLFSKSEPKMKDTLPTASVPVLLYHGIVAVPDRFSMTKETFSNQMQALKNAGYQTVSMLDFYLFMRDHKALPDKSVVI